MPKDNQVLVRVNDQTHEAIQEYKQDRDFNKAEACRRMIETRLVSEGYMEGVVRSDGGIEEAVTNLSDEIDQTQSEVTAVYDEIEEFKSSMRQTGPSLILALLWIGITSAYNLPSLFTVSTGVAIILLMIVTYTRTVL
jgi:hypothetical protein